LEQDQPLLHRALLQDPYHNLFMIGDLEVMGISHEYLFYWGQFSSHGLVGVAMRYKRSWQFYDAGGADLRLFAQAVDAYPEDCFVQGRESLVDAVSGYLHACRVARTRNCHYCTMPPGSPLPTPSLPVRRATASDVEPLARLYEDAGEMLRDADSIRFVLEYNRIFVTEVQSHIVSVALTNVETSTMAMIGGVYTPEPWRNRGYATAAMAALCSSLLADGQEPCLFYDNPSAGAIYHRLGFRELGRWRMVSLEHRISG
jgi:N-acetylglutamate synthase-like GNAT family acetyltransferase